MALNIGDNFKYMGKKFLDERESFDTLEEMNACTSVPEGFITYCKEDGKRYEYKNSAWVEYIVSGSSVDINFDEFAKTTDLPTKLSQLENDTNYVDNIYVDNKVSDLVNSAPETLDTLNKLSQALGDDPNFATTISAEIGNKVDKVVGKDLSTNDLTDELKVNYDTSYEHSQSEHVSVESFNNVSDTLQTHEININKLLEAVDEPPTFTNPTLNLSLNKTVIEHNVAVDVNITPNFNKNDAGNITGYLLKKGDITLVDSTSTQSYTDNIIITHGTFITYTATVYYGEGVSKTSTFGIEYKGLSAGSINANNTIRAYANSYYGVIDSDTVTDVSLLSSRLGTSRGYSTTYNMSNQRSVYMYPQSFGTLSSIKDANNFEYINSYTRSEITYNGVSYYVYILTDPVTITGFKQVFS